MDISKKNRELISVFIDGALPDCDRELVLAALDTPEGRHAWSTFHQIGDVLRAAAGPALSAGFADGLARRLAAEPVPGKRSVTASEAPAAPVHAK